jgi:excisionase family DNA binding protein
VTEFISPEGETYGPDDADRGGAARHAPIAEAAERLSIGRSMLYELMASGAIESAHIGRLRRIPVDCLTGFVERCAAKRANGLIDHGGSRRRPRCWWSGATCRSELGIDPLPLHLADEGRELRDDTSLTIERLRDLHRLACCQHHHTLLHQHGARTLHRGTEDKGRDILLLRRSRLSHELKSFRRDPHVQSRRSFDRRCVVGGHGLPPLA